jgi:hypothetical protein
VFDDNMFRLAAAASFVSAALCLAVPNPAKEYSSQVEVIVETIGDPASRRLLVNHEVWENFASPTAYLIKTHGVRYDPYDKKNVTETRYEECFGAGSAKEAFVETPGRVNSTDCYGRVDRYCNTRNWDDITGHIWEHLPKATHTGPCSKNANPDYQRWIYTNSTTRSEYVYCFQGDIPLYHEVIFTDTRSGNRTLMETVFHKWTPGHNPASTFAFPATCHWGPPREVEEF